MEKHNGARVDSWQQFMKCFFFCGLLILNPVYIGKAPEKSRISKLFCHCKVLRTVDSAGRTVKFWHGSICYFLVEIFYFLKFFLKRISGGNLRHVRVCHGMVSDNMPFRDHPFNKIGIVFQEISHNKKSSRSMVLF